MERLNFLSELGQACRGIDQLMTGKSGRWLTELMAGRKEESKQDLTVDTVYELLCGFTLLNLLRPKVSNLRLIKGKGAIGHRFPYKPGSKEKFSFFRFELNKNTYDLCFGTQIPVDSEPPETPDISLQWKGRSPIADSEREVGQLKAIWDAKFHKKAFSKTGRDQINTWCDILEVPLPQSGDILEQLLPASFAVNAVITNAPEIRTNRTLCIEKGFSILFGFSGDTSSVNCVPSRAEHLAK